MEELQVTLDQDATDNVRITVAEEIYHKTFVDCRGDKKFGEKLNTMENLIESVVEIVIVDAEDYDDDAQKPDQYRLAEIWYNIQPLANIYEIKENLAKDLSLVNINLGDFSDFNLGCTSSLERGISIRRASENENSIHSTLEKSIALYYLASLLLDYVYQHTKIAETKLLLKTQHEHLQNVCNVLENAVKVNEWLVPDLATTTNTFRQFKARLPNLVNEYLSSTPESRFPSSHIEGSRSRLLRQHKQLVVNYEIVSEVEHAISLLNDVFGMMKEKILDEKSFGGIYANVTERSSVWAGNDKSESMNA